MDDSREFEMARISDAMPEIVSKAQWREASAALLAKEKALPRRLAAERRRLPKLPNLGYASTCKSSPKARR
jgi:predicted dithiol-disulfide oxidoreductase (DUF899 family)